ncbi:unnamed protein product, partial [Rotaria sp. Silwood1]
FRYTIQLGQLFDTAELPLPHSGPEHS